MTKGKKVKLKKALGLFETTMGGVGIILGAGIYALVGKAAALGGNAVWISFAIAALVATLTGLSYAELSSMFPKAGAEYVYTEHAFGRRIAFFVGFFLITGLTIAASAVSLGFAGYLHAIFGTPVIYGAIALLLACTLLLLYGVKQSAWVGVIFTLVEVGGLFIIISIGLPKLGNMNLMEMTPAGFSGVFAAAALIFFAYIGFEEIVNLAEETRGAVKTIPKAVVLSIIITTIIYILVALAAISVMGWQALGASKAPLADVAATAFGPGVFTMISAIALFSTANTVLLILLANSRLAFGMARENKYSKALSWLHPKTQTPWIAILVIVLFAIGFLFAGEIKAVADMTNMAIFITFIVINSAVITLRFKESEMKRPFKVPGKIGKVPLVPVLGILVNIFMLSYVGTRALMFGVAFAVIAFVLYEILDRTK
ncbi:MAG: APC family permease [Candidatus Undinarchaeales archaeon]